MKLTSLILTLLLCSQTQAIYLSTSGTGQVLIFPYYTVNGDFNTLITLSNTTDQAKALRVRFREAANARSVFSFNLYLGAHDVWTAGLVKDSEANGNVTRLMSFDKSCTSPANINAGFYNNEYIATLSDRYGDEVNRMHEGFIEVMEMGVLTGESAAATIIEQGSNSPNNCQRLHNAWDINASENYWLNNPSTDLLPPSGGISGNAVLIDITEGIAITEPTTVIEDFSDSILHFSADSSFPNLSQGKNTSSITDAQGKHEFIWQNGLQAINSVLTKRTVSNEYELTDAIGAQTDWILTMPTRQFHVDPLIATSSTPVAPFTTDLSEEVYCEEFDSGIWNREQQIPGTPAPTPTMPQQEIPYICYSTNNISLVASDVSPEDDIGIFSSNYPFMSVKEGVISPYYLQTLHLIAPSAYFKNGWSYFQFEQLSETDSELSNKSVLGLPVIGFTVQKYVNGNLGNSTLANYAGVFEYKSITKISYIDQNSGLHPALSLSDNKKGQVLVYPYYSVKNNLNTLISIVNIARNSKAIKVSFKEGQNSRSVLDFNVYLGAFDVWTAGLVPIVSTIPGYVGEPSVRILTFDRSCTTPNNLNGREFLPFGFEQDTLGSNMERVQEGFIEIIEMGRLTGSAEVDSYIGSNEYPINCPSFDSRWNSTGSRIWLDSPNQDLLPPTGSLYGSASILDIAGGIDYNYDAIAINNYSTEIQHTAPGSLLPNLASGNVLDTYVQTTEGVTHVTWDTAVDAVSALFMQELSSNDFVIEAGIGAQTDWVNLYPTKHFYVDPEVSQSAVALAPFDQVIKSAIGACHGFRFKAFNREQAINSPGDTLIGGTVPENSSEVPQDCWSLNVASAKQNPEDESLFLTSLSTLEWFSDSEYSSINKLPFANGWMERNYADTNPETSLIIGRNDQGQSVSLSGKPVIGFVAQKYVNGRLANDTLANYGVIKMNNSTKKLTVITE